MPLSPHLQPIFDAIVAAHPEGLTLDELSEELIHRPVTYADIDEIIGALEDAGFDLEAPAPPPGPDDLARVLAAIRTLTAETGKRPSPSEIAERTGMSPITVRRALRFGRSAGE
jgi:Sigma-70 region 3